MTQLLEDALRKVGKLSEDEQNAIASQILETLGDEEVWEKMLRKNPGFASVATSWLRIDTPPATPSAVALLMPIVSAFSKWAMAFSVSPHPCSASP